MADVISVTPPASHESLAAVPGAAGPTIAQVGPIGGQIAAAVAVFLAVGAFYAVTLHLAATFFIGDVPSQLAATVAPVPTIVSMLLGRWGLERVGFVSPSLGVLVAVVATLAADGLAIAAVYDLDRRPATALTLLHFAFATVLGIALGNLFGFL